MQSAVQSSYCFVSFFFFFHQSSNDLRLAFLALKVASRVFTSKF